RRRITIPLTLSNLKLLRRITRTENILHRNFTRRQVAIQNRVASNIGISQSTFSVKVLNLFSRSRRKTNKRKSKHSAMLKIGRAVQQECRDRYYNDFPTRRSSDLSAILNFLDESPERKTSFIEISRGGKLPYKTGSPAISV